MRIGKKNIVSLLTLLFLCWAVFANAAKMRGIVVDLKTNKPIDNLSIFNVHLGKGIITDTSGKFEIEVRKGDLVEFRKMGYKIARVNIKSEQLPRFFNIQMQEGSFELDEVLVNGKGKGWKVDSIKKYELYREVLEHYKLTGLDVAEHPFDALSKRNRQIWRFQKNYEYWEQEKFIDYVFNDRLIVQLSMLGSDSLQVYKRLYRPSYAQIRGWNEYQYYNYIKQTVAAFREKTSKNYFKQPDNKEYEIYNKEQ